MIGKIFFISIILIFFAKCKKVESSISNHNINQQGEAVKLSLSNKSFMRHMWTSPVQQFSLIQSNVLTMAKLERIQQDILNYYEDFKGKTENNNHRHKEKVNIITDATLSDLFYREQQSSDLKYRKCLLANSGDNTQSSTARPSCISDRPKIFQELSHIFLEAMIVYLEENYLPLSPIIGDDMSSSGKELTINSKVFAWTSLHANGSHHAAHHHVDSVISGVMYISVPDTGAGDLVFYDPRGSLPPFGKTLRISPKSGDLVLFPGYLVHSVDPTLSSNPRISISFNCFGSWESISDVNIAYFTESVSQ